MATPGASRPACWRWAAFSANSRTGVEFEPERRALGERPPHAQRNPGCRVVPPGSGHWPASEGPLASMIVSTGRAGLARPTTFRAHSGRCGIIRHCRRGSPRPTGASVIMSTGRAGLARPTTFRAYNGCCGMIRHCRRGEPRPTGGYRRHGGAGPTLCDPVVSWPGSPVSEPRLPKCRRPWRCDFKGGGWMLSIAKPSLSPSTEYP